MGDYTAKPGDDYTYRIVALGGTPGALIETAEASVDVSSEVEDDGIHGVWFKADRRRLLEPPPTSCPGAGANANERPSPAPDQVLLHDASSSLQATQRQAR
jgi:hypothetical protein